MNTITLETRRESHEKVDKQKRYTQILDILEEYGELTAREVAIIMHKNGYTNDDDPNNARPRLTELLEKRKVMVVGKTVDYKSNNKVAVYRRS